MAAQPFAGCMCEGGRHGVNERFVQGEKNIGGKGREGSFQVKQHNAGFIGSADDIIFSTNPGG